MARAADNSDDWLWTYADVLLLSFFGMCVLAFVALASINPKAAAIETVKPPGQMMVCASWNGHHDADLWFRPAGQKKATGYSNKAGGVAALLLDDLGTDNIPHIECQFASSLPDGLWVINVHGYAINEPTVRVHVVAVMNGAKLIETNLDVRAKQERTVAQFRLAGGRVVPDSMNQVYVPLRSAGK